MNIEKLRTYAGTAIMDNSMEGTLKLKYDAIWSSAPLLGIYLKVNSGSQINIAFPGSL